jgi:hypothetical protein
MLVILSSGRSGTNLILEMFTECNNYTPTQYPEDKEVFKRDIQYPERYLCKSDTHYIDDYKELKNFMLKNKHAQILFTVRHPYDWVLSKLYRGRPLKRRGWRPADDATTDGCIADMTKMFDIYKQVTRDFPLKILVVKMEDVLSDIEKEAKRICKFLCIVYNKSMTTPHLRMRHEGKRRRYPTLDKSQIGLYKKFDIIYDGYFKDKKKAGIRKIFKSVEPIIEEFGYDKTYNQF